MESALSIVCSITRRRRGQSAYSSPGPIRRAPQVCPTQNPLGFLAILFCLHLSPFSFSRHAHGGCIAAIIDEAAGTLIEYSSGPAWTANLNINYRNPIPLGSTVIIDSRVEKVDGRKIYISCRVRSHDDAVLYNEAT
ncbi:hypothetical protein AB205_0189410, partial [Aquarana catesbeiana]